MDTLKLKKAWEVALAPIKSLPMTAIMMYMTGNTLQIFSIMMVFMAFKNPLVGLVATSQAFERFETESNKAKMVQVKLAYVAMQLVALAVGVWKINAMGLLPFVTSCLSHSSRRMPPHHANTRQNNEVGLARLGSAKRAFGIRGRGFVSTSTDYMHVQSTKLGQERLTSCKLRPSLRRRSQGQSGSLVSRPGCRFGLR